MRYILIILICCGCLLPKKAERQIEKIERKYPQLLADKARRLFPARLDSIKYIKWRDSVRSIIKNRTDTLYRIDTFDLSAIKRELKAAYKFIDGLQIQLDNIPQIYVDDSAKMYLYESRLTEQIIRNAKIEKSRMFFIYGFACISAILILLLLGLLIRSYFK